MLRAPERDVSDLDVLRQTCVIADPSSNSSASRVNSNAAMANTASVAIVSQLVVMLGMAGTTGYICLKHGLYRFVYLCILFLCAQGFCMRC